MLRTTVALALLAACGAPAPLPHRDVELRDTRFAPASPPEGESASKTEEILRKQELTLDDVLLIADTHNPQLEIERKNIDLATAAIWDAKLYPNPSFVLELEDYRTRDGATIGRTQRTAGFNVPVVVGGRIEAATSLAEKEREAAAIHYVWLRREFLSGVKGAFVSVLAARRNAELSRQTRDIAKSLHEVTKARFETTPPSIPEMELLKAAVSLAKAESDLKNAEKVEAVAVKTLHAAMGNIDFPIDRFAGELHTKFTIPSLEALRGQLTAGHPLIEEANRHLEASELALDLAEAQAIPDLGFEAVAGKDGEDATIVEGGFSIPLPIFDRNQGKIMAAEIRIRQSKLQLQSVQNGLVLGLTDAYKTLVAAQERVASYKDEILPKAEKALEQTNDGYKAGKFTYLDVLDAQRTLAEARVAYAAALTDLNLAASDLEKLTGSKLESIP